MRNLARIPKHDIRVREWLPDSNLGECNVILEILI